LINREMINMDGHRAINLIKEIKPGLPMIIITGDDEGRLTQFIPPVYTQPFGGNKPNVDGYVNKRWDLYRRLDSTGVQALALLFPEEHKSLINKHEIKYGPIRASNFNELVEAAKMDKQYNKLYYMR
jgi:hypothetical protein